MRHLLISLHFLRKNLLLRQTTFLSKLAAIFLRIRIALYILIGAKEIAVLGTGFVKARLMIFLVTLAAID